MANANIERIIETANNCILHGHPGTLVVVGLFQKLGRDLGYEVGPGWLYDMYWCMEEPAKNGRFLTGIPMVLETERKPDPHLDGDFQKLVQARADVRVWISTCSNARSHINICEEQIRLFDGTRSGDQYVFAVYDTTTKQPLIEHYVAP